MEQRELTTVKIGDIISVCGYTAKVCSLMIDEEYGHYASVIWDKDGTYGNIFLDYVNVEKVNRNG